jgi:hypothetical protein
VDSCCWLREFLRKALVKVEPPIGWGHAAKVNFEKTGEHYRIVIFQSSPRYLQIATIQVGDDTGAETAPVNNNSSRRAF